MLQPADWQIKLKTSRLHLIWRAHLLSLTKYNIVTGIIIFLDCHLLNFCCCRYIRKPRLFRKRLIWWVNLIYKFQWQITTSSGSSSAVFDLVSRLTELISSLTTLDAPCLDACFYVHLKNLMLLICHPSLHWRCNHRWSWCFRVSDWRFHWWSLGRWTGGFTILDIWALTIGVQRWQLEAGFNWFCLEVELLILLKTKVASSSSSKS